MTPEVLPSTEPSLAAALLRPFRTESKTIRQSGLLLLAGLGSGVFSFTMNILLSRYFGPANFGLFRATLGLVGTAWFVLEWGAHATLVKVVPELLAQGRTQEVRAMTRRFYGLRLAVLAIVLPLIFLLREPFAATFLDGSGRATLIVAGLVPLALGYLELSRSLVTGFQNFRVVALSSLLIAASGGILGVLAAFAFGITGALVGIGVSYSLGSLVNFLFLIRRGVFRRTSVHFRLWPIIRQYSGPVFLANLPALLVGATVPWLALSFSPVAVGHYAFAFTFASTVTLVAGAIAQVLLPRVAASSATGDRRAARKMLRNTFWVYAAIAGVGILGTALIARPLVGLLAPIYLPSLSLFVGLVTFGFLVGFLTLAITYLNALSRWRATFAFNLLLGLSWLVVSSLLLSAVAPRLL